MPRDLYDFFWFDIRVDRLIGGIPANPKLMKAWLEANNAPASAAPDQEAMLERLDPNQTHTNVFYRDLESRPCFESRNMKAAFKEAANILKTILDVKSYRSKLAERVFVGPLLVPITTPLQFAERPINVMTAQGPRTSIKRFEYTENVPLRFTLKVLRDNVVKEDDLLTMLEYLQDAGLGADRSQGAGTFQLLDFKPGFPPADTEPDSQPDGIAA